MSPRGAARWAAAERSRSWSAWRGAETSGLPSLRGPGPERATSGRRGRQPVDGTVQPEEVVRVGAGLEGAGGGAQSRGRRGRRPRRPGFTLMTCAW